LGRQYTGKEKRGEGSTFRARKLSNKLNFEEKEGKVDRMRASVGGRARIGKTMKSSTQRLKKEVYGNWKNAQASAIPKTWGTWKEKKPTSNWKSREICYLVSGSKEATVVLLGAKKSLHFVIAEKKAIFPLYPT